MLKTAEVNNPVHKFLTADFTLESICNIDYNES
jgi:hypothetical protein